MDHEGCFEFRHQCRFSQTRAITPHHIRNNERSYRVRGGHSDEIVELSNWDIEKTLAEKASPQDMLRGAVLLLASSTWNTGGVEGQLNPHMSVLLQSKAKELDLASKPSACIGLGDHRYYYTARAADLLHDYIESHHGRLLLPALKIVDEPYGQEEVILGWGKQLADVLRRV